MEVVIISKNKTSHGEFITKQPVDMSKLSQIEYDTHGLAEVDVVDKFVYDISICKCDLCYTITHLDVIKSFCSSDNQYLVVIEDDTVYNNILEDILYWLTFELLFDVCVLNKDDNYFFNEYQKNERFNMFYDNDFVSMRSYVLSKYAARNIINYYTDTSLYKYVIPITIYDFIKKTKLLSEVITPNLSCVSNISRPNLCIKNKPFFLHVKVNGSIGKRLFQIYTAYAVCRELYHILILDVFESRDKYDNAYALFTVNNTRFINNTLNVEWTDIDKITYKPSLFQKCYTKNVYLEGSFRTEKYFIKYKDTIKNILHPTIQLRTYFKKMYGVLEDFAFLYVAKGSSKKYNLLESFYYEKAIEYMQEKGVSKFLVFSSVDIDSLNFLTDLQYIVVDENKFMSIQLMSLCGKGGICSNSLTSWWGGWLNNNQVVFPDVWFKNITETSDLYFDNCFVLKVI